jgi:MauM/NapG family ferredoxin protein
MSLGGSRRDLLRSTIGKWLESAVESAERRVVHERYVRPPGALPEMGFLAACTRCGACSSVCPVHAIVVVPPSGGLAAGTPYVDARREACVACTDMPCMQACPTGALTPPPSGWEGYRIASLELLPERCITFRGEPCRVCVDHCPRGEAALVIDDTGHPVIHMEGCVGCGMCVHVCVAYPPAFQLTPAEG